MSTRSIIAKENSNGTITAIYCHYDGYVDGGVGEELYLNYKTEKKIDKLLALGDISSLGPTIKTTDAYARDRGEELRITEYKNLGEFGNDMKDDVFIEYVYLWMNDKWYYWSYDDKKLIKKGEGYPLSQEFC